MSGVLSFAGGPYVLTVTVAGGTLQLNKASGASPPEIASQVIVVNSGSVLALNAADVLGYTNGEDALVINGGTVSNITTGSRITIQNPITMTGGMLTGSGSGDGYGVYSFNLVNGVIATSDSSGNPAIVSSQNISLQGGNLIFNVTRGVASPVSDLNIDSAIVEMRNNTYGINQTGNGIMTLLGSNTYSGGTTVSGGTLQLGNGGSTGNLGGGSVTNNAAIVFDRSDNGLEIANNISGSGSLTQTGPGTLTLTGSDTYSGGTAISRGALQVGNGGNLNVGGGLTLAASTAVTIASGGQINLSGGSLSIANQALLTVSSGAALAAAGPTYVNSGGTLLASGGVFTANGGVTVNGGNLLVNGAFSLGSGQTLTVQAGGLADFAQGPFFLDQGTAAHVASSGTLQNVSQVAVAFRGLGNGSLTVDGSNTVVAAGSLLVGGSSAAGLATFSGSSTSTFNYMRIATDFFPGTSGTLTIISGASVNLAGALDLADFGSATGSILVSGAGSRLTQTGSASAVVLGSGALGTANLTVANGATFSAAGPILVNSPAVLDISGGSVIVQASLTGNVIDNSTLDIAPVQSFTYAGNISGSGRLVKDGAASLILSGSNDYSGGTAINAGTLYVTNSDALPGDSSLTVGAGGAFVFDPSQGGAPFEAANGNLPHGVAMAAVPEPGTLALLVAAGPAAWWLWRRRRGPAGSDRHFVFCAAKYKVPV